MTLAEALALDPAGFVPGDVAMARRLLAEAEQSPLLLLSWKERSRGRGKTAVCRLEAVQAIGKRVLVRLRPQGRGVGTKAVSTWASSVLQARGLTKSEAERLYAW